MYFSPNIINMIKWRTVRLTGHMPCLGKKRKGTRFMVGKLDGKEQLGRPRQGWEDTIIWILKK